MDTVRDFVHGSSTARCWQKLGFVLQLKEGNLRISRTNQLEKTVESEPLITSSLPSQCDLISLIWRAEGAGKLAGGEGGLGVRRDRKTLFGSFFQTRQVIPLV